MNGNVNKKPYNQYTHVSLDTFNHLKLKCLLVINDLFMKKKKLFSGL